MKKNNFINKWLEQNQDLEVKMLVERNLAIAYKVKAILKKRKMNYEDFAKKLGKTQPEVSKWLSGNHNLTQKSIIKMEIALDTKLIYVEQEYKYVYLGKIEGGCDEVKKVQKNYSKVKKSDRAIAYAS
jgi:transcriptional regulator with XRE-family HTH domain